MCTNPDLRQTMLHGDTRTHAHKCTVCSDDSTFLTNERSGSYQSLAAAVYQHEIGFNHHGLWTAHAEMDSGQIVPSFITELPVLGWTGDHSRQLVCLASVTS